MSIALALLLCIITPTIALFSAPWIIRRLGPHDTLALLITELIGVSGPLVAIMTVH